MIVVNFEVLPNTSTKFKTESKTKWDFSNNNKVERFYNLVHRYMVHELGDINTCHTPYCKSSEHEEKLEEAQVNKICGKEIFGSSISKQKVIPGWNTQLKHLYEDSKAALINWRRACSSRGGRMADDIRRRRTRFECELKRCKANEDSLRSESLATKLVSRNLQAFWKDVRSVTSNVRRLPQTVEGVSGELDIANLCRKKYSNILKSVHDGTEGTVSETLQCVLRGQIVFT